MALLGFATDSHNDRVRRHPLWIDEMDGEIRTRGTLTGNYNVGNCGCESDQC